LGVGKFGVGRLGVGRLGVGKLGVGRLGMGWTGLAPRMPGRGRFVGLGRPIVGSPLEIDRRHRRGVVAEGLRLVPDDPVRVAANESKDWFGAAGDEVEDRRREARLCPQGEGERSSRLARPADVESDPGAS
jgi:hypothetical protein